MKPQHKLTRPAKAPQRPLPALRGGGRMADRDDWPKCELCLQRHREHQEYLNRCRAAGEEPNRQAPPLRPIVWWLWCGTAKHKFEVGRWLCTEHLWLASPRIVSGPDVHERFGLFRAKYNLAQAGKDIANGVTDPPPGMSHDDVERWYDPTKGEPITEDGKLNEAAWVWPKDWAKEGDSQDNN